MLEEDAEDLLVSEGEVEERVAVLRLEVDVRSLCGREDYTSLRRRRHICYNSMYFRSIDRK